MVCKKCFHFVINDESSLKYDMGWCYRYPPVYAREGWIFPYIDANTWCGEFKANKEDLK